MVKLTQTNDCVEITHNGTVVAVAYLNENHEAVILPNNAERVGVDKLKRVNKRFTYAG